MKRTVLAMLAATAVAGAIPAIAQAQTINDRQETLFSRIETGVRSGDLTRAEADRLRADFWSLARLEQDYRNSRPGLTNAERADLNRRFDALSARIRVARNDEDNRYVNWQPVSARFDNLYRRIDNNYRNGRLTQTEANRLENELRNIRSLERTYMRNGLTNAERRDLDRRMDMLSRTIQAEARDGDRTYGYGYGNANRYGYNR